MSEVKRYEFVYENDFGNEYPAFPRLEVDGDYVEFVDFDRVTAERDALQQRLTAADERADVLEGLLREAMSILQWDENGTPSVALAVRIDAALKPADASDEYVCTGCGSKGWKANCKECVPY